MRMPIFKYPMLALSLGAICSTASAESPPLDQVTEPIAVTVHGATPLPLIAPAWQAYRTYKFGDLASYDGHAFRAKTGSAHRRPELSSQVGWEELNACDDKSKGAVKCELGNQSPVIDKQTAYRREFEDERTRQEPENR